MKLNVDSLVNKEREFIDFDLSDEVSNIEFSGIDYSLKSPVHISGRVLRAGINYILKANVDFVLAGNCSRCLVDVDIPIKYNIDAYLMREEYDEGDYEDCDVFSIEGSTIDLLNLIDSTLSLNMPQRVLCSENCKGICSSCGVDLNLESCKCENSADIDDIDPRFAKLKELLK